MRKKILYPLSTFAVVFTLHATYSIWKAIEVSRQWIQIGNTNPSVLYFRRHDYLLGISYALAGAFTVYAFMKFLEHRRGGLAGTIGGVTLTGILYVGGCFLLGCCGSPMLVVYLSLFGSSFLGVTKPLTLILTTISVAIGLFWMEKKVRASKSCCAGSETKRRTL